MNKKLRFGGKKVHIWFCGLVIEEKMKAGQTQQDFLHFIDSATLSCYKELKNK